MSIRRSLALAMAALTLSSGAVVATAAPASAVGSGGWNCGVYNTFSGASSRRGTSSTSTGPQCGKAKVQVLYTVTGGSALRTPWRTAANMVTQPGVGYDVLQGFHHVTNAAPAYNVVRTT